MVRMSLQATLPASARPAAWPALPPAQVLRAYLLGWVPLFLVYMVTVETDGDFSRGFDVWGALRTTVINVGPAFVLLLPMWAYVGWMERRGFSATRVILNHVGAAMVFAAAWHILLYLLLWAVHSKEAADNAKGRWFLWHEMWGMMMYWVVAGGFTAYRAVTRARADAAATVQAQGLLARTELVALRNKLNPHFLFNTLHSIIALTRKDSVKAEQALLMFSDMLRYVLDTEKAGQDDVPLQQELDFTRSYLELEALRLGKRLSVVWDVDDTALHCAVPALSVQPLVENSIKHAFNPRSTPGELHITAKVDTGGNTLTLTLTVADNGPGASAEALADASGLGLKTVTRRLQLQHGPDAGLQVTTQPGQGFQVQFTLPVQT
jgi:signal transduction histidine kinase